MAKHPEPPPDNGAGEPVPNRRERRGGKSEAPAHRGGKVTAARKHGAVPNPRQYTTRRRGG